MVMILKTELKRLRPTVEKWGEAAEFACDCPDLVIEFLADRAGSGSRVASDWDGVVIAIDEPRALFQYLRVMVPHEDARLFMEEYKGETESSEEDVRTLMLALKNNLPLWQSFHQNNSEEPYLLIRIDA